MEHILTKDKWSQARKKLEPEQRETLAEISRFRKTLKYELEYDLEEGDPNIYEREKILALLTNLEERLDSIANALSLIEEGTYGICENCGREIGSARLEALPHTTFCIECKALTEKGGAARPAGQLAL